MVGVRETAPPGTVSYRSVVNNRLLTTIISDWPKHLCGPESPCSSLASREYPVVDYQTMAEFIGHERLFRMANGQFLLHMSSEGKLEVEERLIWLSVRDALSWLNEAPEQFGSFWEFVESAPVVQRDFGAPLRV
jgi:hypothetical protein